MGTPYSEKRRNLADLVHEVNHQVATYRHLLLSLGTLADSSALRRDLTNTRLHCLKTCDSTKNCVLPQLKSESHEGAPSSDFTKQANQFIGCLTSFLAEMRRCALLLDSLENWSSASAGADRADEPTTTAPWPPSGPIDKEHELEAQTLQRDIAETENILESLENLITVHFSTKAGEQSEINARSRRKGCHHLGNLCSSFKTSYA